MTDYALSIETSNYFTALYPIVLNRQKFAATQSGHGFTFSESITANLFYQFDETVGVLEGVTPNWIGARGLTQNFSVFGSDVASGWKLDLTQTFNLTGDVSPSVLAFIQDIISFSEELSSGGIYHLELSTQLFIQDLIYNVIPGVLTSGVGISELTTIVQGTTVLEQISILHEQESPFIYTLQLAELVSLNSSLQHFFGLSASDNFSFADQSSSQFISYPIIESSLSLSSTIGTSIVFRVTTSDTITIDDQDIIRQILFGLLDDTVEIVAGYISPSGGFTTWVVNTRSGATSEYQNYNFNSFAQIGNKYIGASSTGLYELLGDDDDGETIISTITSGLFQVAGSHFTAFKAAYIGVRGQGDYLLKLISGEGQEYIYRVTAQSMKSARVNFGKGLRSRYFSYELQNIDQDFDLDTIEFLPIGANRRV